MSPPHAISLLWLSFLLHSFPRSLTYYFHLSLPFVPLRHYLSDNFSKLCLPLELFFIFSDYFSTSFLFFPISVSLTLHYVSSSQNFSTLSHQKSYDFYYTSSLLFLLLCSHNHNLFSVLRLFPLSSFLLPLYNFLCLASSLIPSLSHSLSLSILYLSLPSLYFLISSFAYFFLLSFSLSFTLFMFLFLPWHSICLSPASPMYSENS